MKKVMSVLIVLIAGLTAIHAQDIKVNQIGFYKQSQKMAVVPETSETTFTLVDMISGKTVYTGTLSAPQSWAASDESNVRVANFSDCKLTGNFYVKAGSKKSQTFKIADDAVYNDLAVWSCKAFYLWRASTDIKKEFATFNGIDYSRKAGHFDTQVLVHSSAASKERPAGTVLSSPKGWYDAGDYNKYVVNASPAVFPLLHAYELFPEYYNKLSLNIPESNNTIPDILDEVRWETDWLLTMQDPNDGGVYFKLTDASFCGMVMPADAPQSPRYLVSKSTTATLDFAAMLCKTARNFKAFDKEYADKCLAAAIKAYNWAVKNPSIYFTNPAGISTGGYGDNTLTDEFYWAKTELFLATGNNDYIAQLPAIANFDAPTWSDVQTNALLSFMNVIDTITATDAIKNNFSQALYSLSDRLVARATTSPYRVPITGFFWGSNGYAAGMGLVLGAAYKYSNKKTYLDATISTLDYLLGRNATAYSFVSGFGTVYPKEFHDRRSVADGITAPMPGYLCGGPNADNQAEDCGAAAYPSKFGAKSYLDKVCSFSTNEIAINWNGPLVFIAGAAEAFFKNVRAQQTSINTNENGSMITVKYAESLAPLTKNALQYQLLADGQKKAIDSCKLTQDGTAIALYLHDSIKANNTNIMLSSTKDSAFTLSGMQISKLDTAVVVNNVTGCAPVIIAAETALNGKEVILTANKNINSIDTLRNAFTVMLNGVDVTKYALIDTINTKRIIISCLQIYKYDYIGITYAGTAIISNENGVMQATPLITVNNLAPEKPSKLSEATTLEDGYTIKLTFDKTIQIANAEKALSVEYLNNGVKKTAGVEAIVVVDNLATVTLADRYVFADAITVSSIAGGFTTQTGDAIFDFKNVAVKNTLPKIEQYIAIDTVNIARIEAENYVYNNGLVKENCSDAGGGVSLGYTDKGDWTDYMIDVQHAGIYTIKARIASNSKASQMKIMRMNGKTATDLCNISTIKTGGWQTWASVSQQIELEEGKQTIRMYASDDLFNINWLQLSYGIKDLTAIGKNEITINRVYPNPCNGHCFIELDHSSNVFVTDILGKIIAEIYVTKGTPLEITLQQGIYTVKSDKYQAQIIVY